MSAADRGAPRPSARGSVAHRGRARPEYLVAVNAIASERPAPVDAALQVAIYDASGSWSPSHRSSWWWCAPMRPSPISTPRRRGSVVTSMPSSCRARSFSASTSSSRGRHPETAARGRLLAGPLSCKGSNEPVSCSVHATRSQSDIEHGARRGRCSIRLIAAPKAGAPALLLVPQRSSGTSAVAAGDVVESPRGGTPTPDGQPLPRGIGATHGAPPTWPHRRLGQQVLPWRDDVRCLGQPRS
jgi:hypothetical protein